MTLSISCAASSAFACVAAADIEKPLVASSWALLTDAFAFVILALRTCIRPLPARASDGTRLDILLTAPPTHSISVITATKRALGDCDKLPVHMIDDAACNPSPTREANDARPTTRDQSEVKREWHAALSVQPIPDRFCVIFSPTPGLQPVTSERVAKNHVTRDKSGLLVSLMFDFRHVCFLYYSITTYVVCG